jgi:hypothetical protein
MNLALTVTHRGSYLEIDVAGQWSLENLYGLVDALQRESGRHGCNCLLVNTGAMNGHPTQMMRFKAGVRAAEVLGEKIRVALVSPPDRVTKFGENAAVNRGASLRVVTDRAEALQWLLEGAAPQTPPEAP